MTMGHDHTHHGHDAHGAPRRYAGVTIDTHAHWYPPEFIDLLKKDGPKQGGAVEHSGTGYKITAGKLANAFTEEFVEVELRLAGMRSQGVDMQALSLTTPMVYWARPAFGLACPRPTTTPRPPPA